VQAVGAPPPDDGGSPVGLPPPATTHGSSGVTHVQVGCMEHCYGSTTLDTSGLTVAQIEQLLHELRLPSPPTATAAPAGPQHATSQTAAQSQSAGGHQSQAASQSNGTVQVVVTPAGTPADGTPGAAAVNQTAQGVVQLQVGCIFYCSGTRQSQQVAQSTATVQAVDGSAASAVNTVSRAVNQVQVGCIAWCYDAVETQTASGTDSTIVSAAPTPDVAAAADGDPGAAAPPSQALPAPVPNRAPPSGGVRTRQSGGAPIRVERGGLGPGTHAQRPLLGTDRISAVSVSAATGDGAALVSVAASEVGQTERTRHVPGRGRHLGRRRGTPEPAHTAPARWTRARADVVSGAATAPPDLELAVAFALAALGFAAWRWRDVP
jgi:hypothetical protein